MKRDWHFNVADAFQPHFNHAVGQHVSTYREFTDALKRGSDVNSERTGMTHNYQPLMPGDIKTGMEPKTDMDILNTAAQISRDKGLPGSDPKVSHHAL